MRREEKRDPAGDGYSLRRDVDLWMLFGMGVFTIILLVVVVWIADSQFNRYMAAKTEIAILEGEAERPFMGRADPRAGHELFSANCSSCHGAAGEGQIGLAPSLGNPEFLALASDLFIKQTINRGRPGTAMIARPDFNDEALTHIVAYLRSLQVATSLKISVDHSRVVTGNAETGLALYAVYCASCHGQSGEGYVAGGPAPGIGLPGFLEAASDDYIMQTLAHGRSGTPMRSFFGSKGLANLTEREGKDIVSFLRKNVANAAEAASVRPARLRGPPDPQKGESIFAMNCSACHQTGGVGKPGLAPSIRNRDFLALASDNFIRSTVLQGRPGTSMAPRPDLQGAPLEHVIAYLRDLPVSNPIDRELHADRECRGTPANGERLFARFCASCHGPNGEGYSAGGAGPAIGLPGFLSVATDDYLFQTIAHGRVGTPMRGFLGANGLANLGEQEVSDIIVHLRTSAAERQADDEARRQRSRRQEVRKLK